VEITVLGCWTSQGVPLVAHDNPGWDRGEPRNWRTRSSIHVVLEGHHVQVDCGPDFRSQCLSCGIREVDTVILTHGHADHVLGMDDLRQFCTNRGGASIPVYSTDEGLGRIQAIFPYALGKPVSSGYVSLDPRLMPAELTLPGGGIVRSTLLPHGVDVLGLVFEEPSTGARLAYYTDCKRVPAAARELAMDVDVAILDGLRPDWHPTHMTVAEACEVAAAIRARQAYLTHMTYQVDYATYARRLASEHPRVGLAHDGLILRLGGRDAGSLGRS
jgi:phosphoribosyl 1,2-cyclic phosphate phosphodiesterase